MKLSIITINYNNAEGLRKTLASVASQTFRDFEHIIVDGGSTDDSVEIIREYTSANGAQGGGCQTGQKSQTGRTKECPQIRWISEKDNGIYNAMNKGTKIATGEYLLYLNSGDYLVDNVVLSNVFDCNFTEDIVYGDLYIKDEKKCHIATSPNPNEISFISIHYKKLFHPASFIKRELMLNIGGYDEEIKITADFAFFVIAICKYNCSLKKIDIPISVFELVA